MIGMEPLLHSKFHYITKNQNIIKHLKTIKK